MPRASEHLFESRCATILPRLTEKNRAKTIGISPDAVQRIWRAHNLQPYRLHTFNRSRDPCHEATDIGELYLRR